MRVLVVGAGLGGLCLAHGLRRVGIDVQVFERRPKPADQPPSYGIHLNADGLRALHDCLPRENWEQLVGAARPAPDVIRFWSPQLRMLAVQNRDPPENAVDPITQRRAVSRDALRDALLKGLNGEIHRGADVVQWGRELTRFERTTEGRVEAHFANGTRAVGDLLVGADGSNSRVRKQRLPDVDRIELGVLNIAGRLSLTPSMAARLPPSLTDGSVNHIVPPGTGWMFVSTWIAGDHPQPGLQNANPPDLAERYLVWAWAAALGSYPASVDRLSPGELLDLVVQRTVEWGPELRSMVRQTNPVTVARIPLRSMPILTAWPSTNVTLLGDAIHNMTPMAGIGANTALRDALQLHRALAAPGDHDVVARVSSYEKAMRGYANRALALSTRNALNAASQARLKRLAFRTALRLAETVPFVKRAMFGDAPSKAAS